MTTLGAVYVPQLQTERLRSVARAADEAGLEQLWRWEDCFLASGVAFDWPPLGPAAVLSGATGAARLLLDEARAEVGRAGSQPLTVYVLAANGKNCEQRLLAEQTRFGYDMFEETGVAGDAQVVAEAVGRWAAAGADTVVLQPTADDPDPEGFVRFVATEVRPLLS